MHEFAAAGAAVTVVPHSLAGTVETELKRLLVVPWMVPSQLKSKEPQPFAAVKNFVCPGNAFASQSQQSPP